MSIRSKGDKHIIDVGYGENRRRITFTGTKQEAKEVETAARLERSGKPHNHHDPRLREIAAKYLQTYELDHLPSGTAKQKERVDIILTYFGAHNISSITPPMIEAYKRQRAATVKPATINKELSALSQLCKWALDAGMITTIPRIKRYPPKLTKAPVPRIPTPDIIQRILDNTVPRLRDLFRLSFMAGLRPGEAKNIRRENWIPALNVLAITGKGNKTRHIPIVNPEMQAELTRRAQETKSGYLWESPWTNGPYIDIRRALQEAAKRAGWHEPIYPHLLRHAAATELIEGTDVSVVQQILGHSTIKVTETYLHIRQGMMVDAMRKRERSTSEQ